jgi:hypothetical protein
VLGQTSMPAEHSSSATVSVVRLVHLMPVTGSPAVSRSMRRPIASITSRALFSRPPPARAAHPARFDLATKQFLPVPGDGAGADAVQLGDLGVPAVADLHGLEPRVEAPLALVQEAVKQHDRRLQLIWGHPQARAEGKTAGLGVVDRARSRLGAARR